MAGWLEMPCIPFQHRNGGQLQSATQLQPFQHQQKLDSSQHCDASFLSCLCVCACCLCVMRLYLVVINPEEADLWFHLNEEWVFYFLLISSRDRSRNQHPGWFNSPCLLPAVLFPLICPSSPNFLFFCSFLYTLLWLPGCSCCVGHERPCTLRLHETFPPHITITTVLFSASAVITAK